MKKRLIKKTRNRFPYIFTYHLYGQTVQAPNTIFSRKIVDRVQAFLDGAFKVKPHRFEKPKSPRIHNSWHSVVRSWNRFRFFSFYYNITRFNNLIKDLFNFSLLKNYKSSFLFIYLILRLCRLKFLPFFFFKYIIKKVKNLFFKFFKHLYVVLRYRRRSKSLLLTFNFRKKIYFFFKHFVITLSYFLKLIFKKLLKYIILCFFFSNYRFKRYYKYLVFNYYRHLKSYSRNLVVSFRNNFFQKSINIPHTLTLFFNYFKDKRIYKKKFRFKSYLNVHPSFIFYLMYFSFFFFFNTFKSSLRVYSEKSIIKFKSFIVSKLQNLQSSSFFDLRFIVFPLVLFVFNFIRFQRFTTFINNFISWVNFYESESESESLSFSLLNFDFFSFKSFLNFRRSTFFFRSGSFLINKLGMFPVFYTSLPLISRFYSYSSFLSFPFYSGLRFPFYFNFLPFYFYFLRSNTLFYFKIFQKQPFSLYSKLF